MKTRVAHHHSRRQGLATIIMLVMLALVTAYVAANLRALRGVDRDLKLIEQRQIQREQRLKPVQSPGS